MACTFTLFSHSRHALLTHLIPMRELPWPYGPSWVSGPVGQGQKTILHMGWKSILWLGDDCSTPNPQPLFCKEVNILLTKRLELLLRTVLALPKASSRGFDWRMMSLTCWEETQQPGVRHSRNSYAPHSGKSFQTACLNTALCSSSTWTLAPPPDTLEM